VKRINALRTVYGSGAMPNASKPSTNTPKEAGGWPELPAAVVSSGRSPVRGLPISFSEDPTVVEVTVVV